MLLPGPLVEGHLVRRYKRFFAEVELADGSIVSAHCPNPGAMLGLNAPGLPAWLSFSSDPKRRLPATLEILSVDGVLVGINTVRPNALVAEALALGRIPELAGYGRVRREVRLGEKSRLDFLLDDGPPARPAAFVEVKNVHLVRRAGLAEFPDCVTTRGARHLDELAAVASTGARAVLLFVVQRDQVSVIDVARDLDPAYARAYDRARAAGVEVIGCGCDVTPERIEIVRPLAVAPA